MPSETDSGAKSPFAGLDYRIGERPPSTGDIGPLAEHLRRLTGVGPLLALSAAILIDQGAGCEALDLLSREIERLAAEREEQAAQAKAGGRRS